MFKITLVIVTKHAEMFPCCLSCKKHLYFLLSLTVLLTLSVCTFQKLCLLESQNNSKVKELNQYFHSTRGFLTQVPFSVQCEYF